MADGLLHDLPRDLPTFLERFGTDEDCRAYLVQARWPAGFGCTACGHDQAYSHKKRLIEECRACGKQHSILAGTIFEQTKTGLARWFLASIWSRRARAGSRPWSCSGRWALAATARLGRGCTRNSARHGCAGPQAAQRAGRGR